MTIDQFVYRYEPGDPTKPALLLLHGTGGDEHDLVRFGEAVAEGRTLLSPRGLVSENGVNRWFARFAEGVFDLKDMAERTRELSEWIDIARSELLAEDQALDVLGYSNGANIAANLVLQGYDGFRKGVLLRPMFTDSAREGVRIDSTDLRLHVGRMDGICPPGSAERLLESLQNLGVSAEIEWVESGHNLTQIDVLKAAEFLNS